MAINNNILYNAAYRGFLGGIMSGVAIKDTVAADYVTLTQAAQAFATEFDSFILFDGLITTAASNTQLAQTTNTITANEQARGQLAESICRAAFSGVSGTVGIAGLSTVAANYAATAQACAALYTEALLLLVTP
jgi:hypothetical protein